MIEKVRKIIRLIRPKPVVLILCSMRSGSTLLKSLIANAPDTSHLPEVDFQKYRGLNAFKLKLLGQEKIIILKKPANYEDDNYPAIPKFLPTKKIILVRDVGPTVQSLRKMNEMIDHTKYNQTSRDLAIDYWASTYHNILNKVDPNRHDTFLVRYEDLVSNPVEVTAQLFQFIGSKQKTGVATYSPPKSYKWQWGNDDGGEKIKTLTIQQDNIPYAKEPYYDHPSISKLRKIFNYD